MGFENEVEQSIGRPCRQTNGRSSGHCELTSSIVPRGTSWPPRGGTRVSPIRFDYVQLSRCNSVLAPAELGAIDPDAVHDDGPATRQRDDCLFHAAAPGNLHRPGLEPGPFR